MKDLQEDKDWVLINNDLQDSKVLIKLLSTEWKDIIFEYDYVRLDEVDSCLKITFNYNVKENPTDADTNSKGFINHIGDILAVMLSDSTFKIHK